MSFNRTTSFLYTSPSVLVFVQLSTRCLSQNTSDLTTSIAPMFMSNTSSTLCIVLLVVFHVLRCASSTTHKPTWRVSGLKHEQNVIFSNNVKTTFFFVISYFSYFFYFDDAINADIVLFPLTSYLAKLHCLKVN